MKQLILSSYYFPLRTLHIVIVLLFFIVFNATAQNENWSIDVRIGANINLNWGLPKVNNKLKFPGIRLYSSCIINRKITKFGVPWIINYGGTVAVYSKSLGNDLNPLNHDIQIDFVNTLSFGAGFGKQLEYDKLIRTMNNAPSYNIKHNYEGAFIGSTNFVINNHKRFQTLGSYSGSIFNYSFNYTNDNGPVIDFLPISDNLDRWWNGTVGLFMHTKESYNRVELSYDIFTGYSPLVYELTSLFGINIPDYKGDNSGKTTTPRTYNAAAYNMKIHLNSNTAIDFGVNGSLSYFSKKRNQYVYWSLQDATHIARGKAFHPGSHFNRLHFGITSTTTLHQEIFY